VTLVTEDLENLTYKDEQYAADVLYMRSLAEIAFENDPIVGYSGFVPLMRSAGNIRLCMGGECPIGNLFTDALRWYTGSDLAFVTSGGVRGPGWEEGPVRVQDIWDALPFANTICTGSILGVHLFGIFNYSTSLATYQATFTEDGDYLLQVSGVQNICTTHSSILRG
jgi:2',3'-cyclic-nucleotide 2'-phosphodiesterase (5'-nucleotidase family)